MLHLVPSNDQKSWRMLYGTDHGAIVFTSPDFYNWTMQHYINGNDDPTGMWEVSEELSLIRNTHTNDAPSSS
jgi:hypothetical protein